MATQLRACGRILSGIQPTGIPHLGNYFGAITQWIKISKERRVCHQGKQVDCDEPIFTIVDIHAYSSNRDTLGPKLYSNILSTLASLMALGLNTDQCILFRQSDIPEHCYLESVLHNFISIQRLQGMIQFKEKSRGSNRSASDDGNNNNNNKSIKSSLLNYPVLQAADILLYRANLVPVGEDQQQHIELTRDIATHFNLTFNCQLFPAPQAVLVEDSHARRVRSLRDPVKKMSKSDPSKYSLIEVVDEPDMIVAKCKRAFTDPEENVYYAPDSRPGVANLMRLYSLATNGTLEHTSQEFEGLRIVDLKTRLAEALIELFAPARAEFGRLMADPGHLERVFRSGAQRARPLAHETLMEVKHLLGSLGRA